MRSLDRRALLKSAFAIAIAQFASGCRLQQSGHGTSQLRLQTDPFTLGVASGDPSTDGFVIWTRLPDLPAAAVEVSYEIAADEAFRRIVRTGSVTAVASTAHALHVELRGLRPGAEYWYRFRCADAVSRTGHARTVPLHPKQLKAAVTSCQHWEQGFFSAYADIVAEDVDLIFQLGDYIYEESFGSGPDVRRFSAPMPCTLADFRARHALYRTDPHLQDAHAFAPFVVTWDDHEVRNDYASVHGALEIDPLVFRDIRAAAYQAYFEHMPIRPTSLRHSRGEVRIFRRLTWPSLATFHVLDTRQYRDAQPCSSPGQGHPIIGCSDASADHRTILGAEQEGWLEHGLASESSTWTVLMQQTLFASMRLPQDAIWSDFWDAYQGSRRRISTALRKPSVRNAVIVGGDLHSFWVNDIRDDFGNAAAPVIATEILTSCLAARNGPEALFAVVPSLNPHVRYLDNEHSGYTLLDIDRDAVKIDLRAVQDISNPRSRVASLRQFVIEAGRAGAVRA